MARPGRRPLLSVVVAALLLPGAMAGCTCSNPKPSPPPSVTPAASQERLDDLEARTFRFFWETANPETGLIPDRYPTPSPSSIAAVGFGLTAYGIGVERGYVSREAARDRVLTTLRFLHAAPQGPEASGVSGYRGFFYHFLDMRSGHRFETNELSTVDTALLLGGVLFAQSYFDGDSPQEAEIRKLADKLYRRVDWRWAQTRPPAISHGWSPEAGFIPYDWRGYNEAMLMVLLALGSPTFPVEPNAWQEWASGYGESWGTFFGQEHLSFPPLFGHQYSHVWVDFRGIQDDYMRGRGIDYFENSRRATYAQRAYAMSQSEVWKGYGQDVWGLTACDGPADVELDYQGKRRLFRSYAARGPGIHDDGTLAPTAAAASIPFAPEIAIPAVMEMHRRYGEHIYSTYGFLDSFNPSFTYDVPLKEGRLVPGFGWVATDYLGIDQGPIIAMIENHRNQFVWRVMRKNPYLRTGLERAGFKGGWLEEQK
ncbi:glucoamylase family protein [Hyalangium rubrum]|uniref:Glucoamylase family protein n=1 Tax=Hyalangium rubrum TaxID=3103134 RepID=A0ABU5H6S0_9BACT|nr:glucoamylase family protein [Hyalangium sp. s54d21]MDY7228817.1 glucoamylase family protein [Hyalangium sp. s54d21]